MAGLRKRLRVVEMPVPWTELMAELTGDQIDDEPIILNFARRMGVSRRTIDTKIQLHRNTRTSATESSRIAALWRKRVN